MTRFISERRDLLTLMSARRIRRTDQQAVASDGQDGFVDGRFARRTRFSRRQDDTERRPLILLVEDDNALASVLEEWLGSLGYRVWRAAGVAETRALVPQLPAGRLSLILLDLILPDGDGLALCADLRADPSTAHTPIIVCSGTSRTRDAILSLKLGADYFVNKPFNFAELEARIAALQRDHRARAQGLRRAI